MTVSQSRAVRQTTKFEGGGVRFVGAALRGRWRFTARGLASQWAVRPPDKASGHDLAGRRRVVSGVLLRQATLASMPSTTPRLKGFRFPCEVVANAVRARHRFALSAAEVEDLSAERGVIVSREAVGLWIDRFGGHFAACMRRGRPRPADRRRPGAVVISIDGEAHRRPVAILRAAVSNPAMLPKH